MSRGVAKWQEFFEEQALRRNAVESDPFRELIASHSRLRRKAEDASAAVAELRERARVLDADKGALEAQLKELQLAASGVVLRSGREKALEESAASLQAQLNAALVQHADYFRLKFENQRLEAEAKLAAAWRADAEAATRAAAEQAGHREAVVALLKNENASLRQENEQLRLAAATQQAESARFLQDLRKSKQAEVEVRQANLELEQEVASLRRRGAAAGQALHADANALASAEASPSASFASTGRASAGPARFTANAGEVLVRAAASHPPSYIAHQTDATHEGVCYALAMTESGSHIWTAGNDKVVRQWDAANGQPGARIAAQSSALALDSASERLVAGCADSICRVWELATMRCLCQLTGHTEKVIATYFAAGAASLWSAGADRALKLWDVSTSAILGGMLCASSFYDLAVTSDRVCSAHHDGALRTWDSRASGRVVAEIKNVHDKPITCVRVTGDGVYAVTLSRDNRVRISDLRTLQPVATIENERLVVSSNVARLCLSPDGNFVAAGTASGCLLLWSIANRTAPSAAPKVLEKGHGSSVHSLAWSPDGRGIASLGQDHRLVFWR